MCGANRSLLVAWAAIAMFLTVSSGTATASQPDPQYSFAEFQDLQGDSPVPLIALNGNGSV